MSQLRWRGMSGERLGVLFQREGERTSKRALRHMRRVSSATLKTAIAWSPVDYKGRTANSEPLRELEKSHKLVEEYGDDRRLQARIEVGGIVEDTDVDAYAMWIHEGSYTPGPATRAKGPDAGPFWLERAMEKHEDEFEPLLDDLLKGLMG